MAAEANPAPGGAPTRSDPWTGFWRLADPKISITSVACMIVGGAVAAVDGVLDWLWLGVTGLALSGMEVAKNAWGDVFDYDSGTDLRVAAADRTDFSGGKRVLVDGLLSRGQTWAMAIGFGGFGVLLGAVIVLWREPAALWIGVAGLLLGWSYHGPPLRLCYRGFGELDVVLCYGPLIVLSTYLVQAGAWSWPAFGLSLPLGVFTAAFLWVNEFPDHDADRASGKRNLVVRLGRERAARALPWIYGLGFAVLVALPWLGRPPAVLLGLIALPTAVLACRKVLAAPASWHRHEPVQPLALFTFVLYAIGVAGGVLLAGRA